jgi:predicted transcriptional regulator
MAKVPLELGKRERQLVEAVTVLGEASVGEVRDRLQEPPSYSAVRTMLGVLVEKGWLKQRRDGKRYLYRAAQARDKSQRSALRRLLNTFFDGSAGDAVAALLDLSVGELTAAELERLRLMIDDSRKSGRKQKE